MGTVSLQCGSVREPSDEPPETTKVEDEEHLLCIVTVQKHTGGLIVPGRSVSRRFHICMVFLLSGSVSVSSGWQVC